MRCSMELTRFNKFINAVDVLDSRKNEVMVWITEDGKFEVDFSIVGKPAKARMYVEENVECGIILFDELQQYDGKFIVNCENPEEYTKLAERMISYLHLPRDQF